MINLKINNPEDLEKAIKEVRGLCADGKDDIKKIFEVCGVKFNNSTDNPKPGEVWGTVSAPSLILEARNMPIWITARGCSFVKCEYDLEFGLGNVASTKKLANSLEEYYKGKK